MAKKKRVTKKAAAATKNSLPIDDTADLLADSDNPRRIVTRQAFSMLATCTAI